MGERMKDPKFWAMLLMPICTALMMYLDGKLDIAHAIGTALSGLIAGLMGVAQPQMQLVAKAPAVPPGPGPQP